MKFKENPLLEVIQEYVLFLGKFTKENGDKKLIAIGNPSGIFNIKDNKTTNVVNHYNVDQ